MKIAVPIKMNKKNAPIAPLFGKAKWFAIVENGNITIQANPCHGGQAVIEWLAHIGVDTLIIQEMGKSPYLKLKSYGTIALYHTGFTRILLEDLLKSFENNRLTQLNDNNIDAIIQHHEKRHPSHEHTH